MSRKTPDKKTQSPARAGVDAAQETDMSASELSEQDLDAVAGGLEGDTDLEPSDADEPSDLGDPGEFEARFRRRSRGRRGKPGKGVLN